MIRFRKKRGKDEEVWEINKRRVTSEFCYFGYLFNHNGQQNLNVTRRVK